MSPLNNSLTPALPEGSLILITGATGFIGSNVIQEALDAGYKVRGTSRSQEKADETAKLFDNHSNLTIAIVKDVKHEGAWEEAVKGANAM
jgi:nucleoside-diphosphate-sugar epimerase